MSHDNIGHVVAKAIEKINRGELSPTQLEAYYDKIKESGETSADQKRLVAEAVESQLRQQSPARANRLFGKIDAHVIGLLQKLLEQTKAEFDLSNNCVKTTVKTGGDQLSGEYAVDAYISYKNDDGHRASIEVRQRSPKSPAFVVVRVQDVPLGKSVLEERFEVVDFDAATTLYRKELASLLGQQFERTSRQLSR